MKQIEKNGQTLVKKVNFKAVLNVMLFMMIMTLPQMGFAQDVAQDIKTLFEEQIKPIVNIVVVIGVFIAAASIAIMFFQGKKEGMKNLVYVIVGLLVIKFLVVIAEEIVPELGQ